MIIRNTYLKPISICTVFIFVYNTIFPTLSLALTNGASLIDYSRFESGSTDMVNLSTGNLAYSIPMMNVPSPEGGFSFNLSYHSGIQLEQEASWVGLGWSMNMGAINRTVSNFPDDFKGEISENKFRDPGGWNSILFAPFYTHHISSDGSRGGQVNIGGMQFGWGSLKGFKSTGISIKKGKILGDPVEIGLSIAQAALMILLPGSGLAAAATSSELIAQELVRTATQRAVSIASTSNSTYNRGLWNMHKSSPDPDELGYETTSWYLNYQEDEKMYGTLYLGDINTNGIKNLGRIYVYQSATASNPFNLSNWQSHTPESFPKDVSSDMYTHILAPIVEGNTNTAHIAYDSYHVMGNNVSGSIKPYRHEVGSLCLPNRSGSYLSRYNISKYLPSCSPACSTKKVVNFEYLGEMANRYDHHLSGTLKSPTKGISVTKGTSFYLPAPFSSVGVDGLHYTLDDPKFRDFSTTKTEVRAAGKGLSHQHLATSRYVKWYTNDEIINGYAQEDGFIDMEYSDMSKAVFRDTRSGEGYTIPGHGIGGFKVVGDEGTTYHYATPVYNISQENYVGDGFLSFSERKMNDPYAITWLLTAITGSDFKDRAPLGTIGEEDWGGWVKFDYRRFAAAYEYRYPYHKDLQYAPSGEDKEKSKNQGKKEMYYLDKIQTRTHTALFIKDVRLDGRSFFNSQNAHPTSRLSLDQIILLTNKNYNSLVTTHGLSRSTGGIYTNSNYGELQNGELIDKVFDTKDISTTQESLLVEMQVQRIRFNHNYKLCNRTYNSFRYNGSSSYPTITTDTVGRYGKLTLNSISTYGRKDMKVMPDYEFEYSTKNPDYNAGKWDQWGMFYEAGLDGYVSHKYINSPYTSRDEDYWHIKKITTPTGSEIKIDYERDDYSEISGVRVNETNGGDVRVAKITVKDELDGVNYSNATKYEYDLFNEPESSSGVCSFEPDWHKQNPSAKFYKRFDYPNMPIMYKNVTVYEGVDDNDDYTRKKTYEFETIDRNKISMNTQIGNTPLLVEKKKNLLGSVIKRTEYQGNVRQYVIKSNLASVGRLNAIKEYNNEDHLINSSVYHFVDEDNYDINDPVPGLRTEGSWLNYQSINNQDTKKPIKISYYQMFIKTTKIFYPNVLSSVNVTQDGYSYEIKNTEYDQVTGTILKQQYSNSLGYDYESEIIPAHFEYSSMGSKVDDPNNKNMMSQKAGEYLYVKTQNGYEPLSGSMQTWSKNGNANKAWRKKAQYVWSSHINKDGTFKNTSSASNPAFVLFNFTSPPNGWQKIKEVTKYSEFSFPHETLVGEDTYTASRRDNTGVYLIASATNARYGEFTYSGAENPINSSSEYDGEIKLTGSASRVLAKPIDTDPGGAVDSMEAHTGFYVYKIPAGSSLAFESKMGTTHQPIPENKVYRLSFWQHDLNYDPISAPCSLKVELWGGTKWHSPGGESPDTLQGYHKIKTNYSLIDDNNVVNCNDSRFGDWHLVDMDILVDDDKAFELRIYLENPASRDPIYVDDYRILPLNASMNATVIDPKHGKAKVLATLNNQNIGTRYYYYYNEDYKVDMIRQIDKEYIDESAGDGGFKKIQEKHYNIFDHTVQ